MSWDPETDDGRAQLRADSIRDFEQRTTVTGLRGLIQVGHDTPRLRLELTGQDDLEIAGGYETLMSRAKTLRLLLARGYTVLPCKPADWEDVVVALRLYATQVHTDQEETLASQVLDHLAAYINRRSTTSFPDVASAAPSIMAEEPFQTPTHYHLKVSDLAMWMRRERLVNTLTDKEIRHGLTDLGFERRNVSYKAPTGAGKSRKITSASYYRVLTEQLDDLGPKE